MPHPSPFHSIIAALLYSLTARRLLPVNHLLIHHPPSDLFLKIWTHHRPKSCSLLTDHTNHFRDPSSAAQTSRYSISQTPTTSPPGNHIPLPTLPSLTNPTDTSAFFHPHSPSLQLFCPSQVLINNAQPSSIPRHPTISKNDTASTNLEPHVSSRSQAY